MKRTVGLLAILAVVASSFTACGDFPVDPFPHGGGPADTLDNGWPDGWPDGNGGGGGCDTSAVG